MMIINEFKSFDSNNRDYTYKKYIDEKIVNQSVVQSLFNGAQFLNCFLEKCDFSRCDYEGVYISNTMIEKSIYRSADIKSVIWKNCKICNCIFNESYISNNIFIDCIFENCSFVNSIFMRNTIKNTIFSKCSLSQATFSLCTFNMCSFNSMSLGDCSFYKQILHLCKYNNISMNVDSLGQLFGFEAHILKDINYIFLGKEYGKARSFSFELLSDVFKQKDWLFEAVLLKYNYGQLSNFELIMEMANYFELRIEECKIIKYEELEFFIMIVEHLQSQQKLPLFPLLQTYQLLYDKLSTTHIDNDDFNIINVKSFVNKLLIIINELIENYYINSCFDDSAKFEQEITVHYDNKKAIYFHNIINDLNEILGLEIKEPARLVEVKQGSFIEIIIASVLGISALQFFLYGVNGVLLQLIDLKAKWKTLKAKNPPSYIMSLTREGKQVQPEAFNIIMNKLKDENLQKALLQYARQLKDTEFISKENEDNN